MLVNPGVDDYTKTASQRKVLQKMQKDNNRLQTN